MPTNSPTNLENAERAEMEPKVKALKWFDQSANTPFGPYSVEYDDDEEMNETPYCVWSPNDSIGHYATIEAAKAAAQQDYEDRIRSCLLDKPEAGEAVNNSGSNGETLEKSCRNDAKSDPENQNIDRLRRELEEARKALEPLRELVERAQAIISTSTYPNWHAATEAVRAALSAGREE